MKQRGSAVSADTPIATVKAPELSGRERQILGLAASGRIDKEIATELNISVNTLRTYWSRIRKKSGHLTRSALTAAFAKGALAPDPSLHVPKTTVLLSETSDPEVLRRAAIYYATVVQRTETMLECADRAVQTIAELPVVAAEAPDEQTFLNRVCRLVMEVGGFPLVWIGLAQDDEAKSVRIAAYFGNGSEYLSELNISWGEGPRAQGASGTAIRTRRPEVNHDIWADPKLAPWRALAEKAGFQSQLALPLLDQKRAFGNITICSHEPDRFDRQEIELFQVGANRVAARLLELRT